MYTELRKRIIYKTKTAFGNESKKYFEIFQKNINYIFPYFFWKVVVLRIPCNNFVKNLNCYINILLLM